HWCQLRPGNALVTWGPCWGPTPSRTLARKLAFALVNFLMAAVISWMARDCRQSFAWASAESEGVRVGKEKGRIAPLCIRPCYRPDIFPASECHNCPTECRAP